MFYPVILAGGRGERFWPYSNSKHPKQLLPLVTKKSMMEDTLANIQYLRRDTKTFVIISQNLEQPTRALLKGRKHVQIVAEPEGRNTAAAIALAARLIAREDPQGVMIVLTADHAISPGAEFARAMRAAVSIAEAGDSLVTFGIRPTRPDVGFGYVETHGDSMQVNGLSAFKVNRFHEKPSEESARQYLESGRFFWNSGMFAWRVDYLWERFRVQLPEIHKAFEKAGDLGSPSGKGFAGKLKSLYGRLPEISIDYGILEGAPDIRLVVPRFNWDDIGSWAALDRRHAADAAGNRKLGDGALWECEGVTAFSDSGMIAAMGVKDLLIVQHEGVTLVVPKDQGSRLKELVKQVQKQKALAKYL